MPAQSASAGAIGESPRLLYTRRVIAVPTTACLKRYATPGFSARLCIRPAAHKGRCRLVPEDEVWVEVPELAQAAKSPAG